MNAVNYSPFIQTVFDLNGQGEINKLTNPNVGADEAERVAKQLYSILTAKPTSTKRYQFPPTNSSYRDRCLHLIFEKSFAKDPDNIIAAAERLDPAQPSFYPLWKRVCWIQIPKATGAFFNHSVTKWTLCISVGTVIIVVLAVSYAITVELVNRNLVPLVINYAPIQAMRMWNSVAGVVDWIWENPLEILLLSCAIKCVPLFLPNGRIRNVIRQIDLWEIFVAQRDAVHYFILLECETKMIEVWDACKNLHYYFDRIAANGEKERQGVCKQRIYTIWKNEVIEKMRPQPIPI